MASKKFGLGSLLDFLGESIFGDLHRSLSGSGLTTAELEQNEFNAAEADKAREFNAEQASIQRSWQEQMDNTKVQRSVADMQAAGVNPAMMMGGTGVTASTPSGSAASGPAASGSGGSRNGAASLGALMDLAMIGQRFKESNANISAVKAETSLKNAEAERTKAESRERTANAEFLERTMEDRVQGVHLANNLTDAQISQTYGLLEKARAETKKAYEEAETEGTKRTLNISSAMLNNANARQIAILTPYLQEYYSASSENQRATALRASVAAAYEQGLIDNGMIQAAVANTNADTNAKDVEAHYKQVMEALASHDKKRVAELMEMGTLDKIDLYFAESLDAFRDVATVVSGFKK